MNTQDMYGVEKALQMFHLLSQEKQTSVHISRPLSHKKLIAIVGAGPAGLSAACCLNQRGYHVTLFDALPVAGGLMAAGIPASRLPRAQLRESIEAILQNPLLKFHLNTYVGRDIKLATLQKDFDVLIFASGLQKNLRSFVSGEQLQGVAPALKFLRAYNLNPSKTKVAGNVAVIGGEDTACGYTLLDTAYAAREAGAQTVYLLSPGFFVAKRNWKKEALRAQNHGIIVYTQVVLTGILGTEDMNVDGIHCRRITSWAMDSLGRIRPVHVPGSDFYLDVNTVLMAIGERPDLSILYQPQHSMDQLAQTESDIDALSHPPRGVFLAGDIVSGPGTLVRAIEHGCSTANVIHRYLREQVTQSLHT
jgi:NADPH-dependent glutamate synthase beta subunit-like oxidoreductase